MKNINRLNIAIIGLGNIGSYLYKYLQTNKEILSKKNNCIPNVIFISAKNRNKKRYIKINKKKWLKNYLDATKSKEVENVTKYIENTEIIKNIYIKNKLINFITKK